MFAGKNQFISINTLLYAAFFEVLLLLIEKVYEYKNYIDEFAVFDNILLYTCISVEIECSY